MTDKTEEFRRGIELFNDAEFFEAHEVWEEEWLESDGVDKAFLQGLIQTAAAYVNHERGMNEGVERLSESALRYLEDVPDRYRGVNVDRAREINKEVNRRASQAIENDSILVLPRYRLDLTH